MNETLKTQGEEAHGWRAALEALRPAQWTKNLLVLAALGFAWGDRARPDHVAAPATVAGVLLAAIVFCAVSSAVYLVNDLLDIEADRAHPLKRHRPIAARRLSPARARLLATALLAGGGLLSLVFLPGPFLAIAAFYVLLQSLYSIALKRIALADIIVIAAGFVLRALAGAYAARVSFSPWLLLCAFFLALFLAVGKRRHEKASLADNNAEQRPSLDRYSLRLLDQLAAITAAVTIVVYALYTQAPETVEKFGTSGMGFTLPFVVFGIFRYLDLLYRHNQGDQPEKALLADRPLLVTIGLYGLTVLAIFMIQ